MRVHFIQTLHSRPTLLALLLAHAKMFPLFNAVFDVDMWRR